MYRVILSRVANVGIRGSLGGYAAETYVANLGVPGGAL